jgi:glycosyltransferase involved in cell wall biosynthesis
MIMHDAPLVLVNHLLEPPAKITGITRYLFALLEELVSNNEFQYALFTTWSREDLPEKLRAISRTRPFVASTPLNIAAQMAVVPRIMRETRATLEFNCNPIGCFWPFWPRIITVHDLYFELMPQSFPRRHRVWWRLIFPRALDAASAIICVSEASRQNLKRYYPRSASKAVVVHEAGALKDGAIAKGDTANLMLGKPYGLYIGNLSPNKNPSVLVDALKLLEQKGVFINLYHIGRDELALLAQAQQRIDLQHPIRSLGMVDDVALAAMYREALCLVNTSLDEGFCLPILEAQSRGIPVVCSDIPVLREVAGDGALYFNPMDPAALAEALSKMFAEGALRANMGKMARQNAEQFSWARAAAETETIFRNVITQKGRKRRMAVVE